MAKVKRAAELEEHGSGLAGLRVWVRMMYKSTTSMCFFAVVIVASFAVSLAEAQFKPASSSHLSTVFYGAEISFAGIFSLELLINLFSSVEFWPFFSSRWNWFDIQVVIVCWVGVGEPRWPALNLIRLIRVFRVIKLIKWSHSLNHLLSALTSSILPVLNSLILFFIFTSIFAILATHLYGEDHEEFFGDLSSSMFTMLQVIGRCLVGHPNSILRHDQ